MAWFRKKRDGSDVGIVDLSELQRRGIFKPRAIPKKAATMTDSQGYADLTGATSSSASSSGSGGVLDFLSGLASAASASDSSSSSSGSNEAGAAELIGETNATWLKNKVEDVEFKIESIYRKLNNLSERMEVVEKRLNRVEGRGGD